MDMDVSVRAMTPADDRMRFPQQFRRDMYDGPRYHYDSSYVADQGPGPATFETTPPRTSSRQKPRFVPHVATRASQDKNDCLTAEQTIELFARKIEEARKETQHALHGTEDVSDAIRPTLTIDLGRARIERLPDTIIDLIIADVERLSLSHNLLRYVPSRISDCIQLRYLNIRSNDFREIPPSIYSMPLLEILDISKNKITTIPPEIKNVEKLRVFSIVSNRLTDLPVELADLPRLKVLKVADNPFRRSIKKVIHDKELEVAFSEMLENERDTALTAEIVQHLRKLNQTSTATNITENSETPEPQTAVEPSKPSRRALSGRFPVVPAALPSDPLPETSDSQSQPGKPSLPTRSHLRGLSGQSISGVLSKRPGIAPLISGSERNRSNSESVIQATAVARQRRMGMVRRDRTELDSIDETKVVRQSHARGLSYGSVLRRNGSLSSPGAASSSPGSPKDIRKDRSQFVRRLSSLPEHKTDQIRRPLIEGAKGILYALYQVHPHISGLISAGKGRDARTSGLEMSFYNASVHVDKLNKSLELVDTIDPEDEEAWERAEETVNNDCATCIKSFVHVTSQMQECTHKIIAGSDPRYVRSLMLLLYGSVVEIRNAIKSFGIEVKHHRRQMSSGATHPIATIPEESTPETPEMPRMRPDRDVNGTTSRKLVRNRSDTVLKLPTQNGPSFQPVQPPALQIPSNMNPNPTIQGTYNRAPSALSNASTKSFAVRSRSNSRGTGFMMNGEGPSSTVPSTPRSTDSYNLPPATSVKSRTNPDTGLTDAQEEQCFESIFMALTKAYEAALQAVPITMQHLQRCSEAAVDQRQPREVLNLWNALAAKSRTCLDLTQALQLRLTSMKFKDSGVGLSSAEGGRHDPSFWTLCKSFLSSFVVLVTEMKDVRKSRLLTLPQEIVGVLRPVQKACQEAGHAITTSPWNYMLQGVNVMPPAPTPFASRGGEPTRPQQLNKQANNSNSNLSAYASAMAQQQNNQALFMHYPPSNKMQSPPQAQLSSASTLSLSATTGITNAPSPQSSTSPVPATPLSAALGPAAQATIPSTPATSYGDSFFKGDVFQRADSLLNMQQAAGTVKLFNRR